jgi:tetratricopeptide (TPR) repeat protein
VDRLAADLAVHFGEAAALGDAGDIEKAVRYGRRAGSRALARLAYEEAADHFQRALHALDRTELADPALRCDLLLELGDATRRMGSRETSQALFEEAADIARSLGDGRRLGLAAVAGWGGYALSATSGPVQALFEEALDTLELDDSPLRAELLANLALHLNAAPERADDVRRWSAEAVAMADRLGVPDLQVLALLARYTADAGPDLPVAHWQSEIPRLEALAEQCGEGLGWAAHMLTRSIRLESADREGANEDNQRLMAYAERFRSTPSRAWATGYESMRAFLDGRLDNAERHAGESLNLGITADPDVAIANYGAMMLVIRWAQARLSEIEPQAALLVEQYPAYWASACAVSTMYAELGRYDDARAHFEAQAVKGFATLPRNDQWLVGMWCLCLTCRHLEDQERGEELYAIVAPQAHRVVSLGTGTVSLGSMQLPAGAAALAAGRIDDAVCHLREAVAANRHLRARPWVTYSWTLLAMALLARGGAGAADEAAEALGEAIAVAGDDLPGIVAPAAALLDRIRA